MERFHFLRVGELTTVIEVNEVIKDINLSDRKTRISKMINALFGDEKNKTLIRR